MDAEAFKNYYPSLEIPPSQVAEPNVNQLCASIFPQTTYSDNEKVDIGQWLVTSTHLAAADEDEAKHAERLGSLNNHLSTRTTLLGTKPSIADVATYTRLAPAVSQWAPSERTGERGYHHIVRFMDFVQNSPLYQMSLGVGDKVEIDPEDVVFVRKPVDPKEEKERKRREKTGTTTVNAQNIDTKPLIVDQNQTHDGENKPSEQKAESTANEGKETMKALGAGGSSKEFKKEKRKEKQPKPSKQPAKEISLSPCLIDLRVGHILKAVAHPNADSLYVSTIALGDPPGTDNTSEYEGQIVRTVCSGLNGLVPLADMQNRKVVAVCNLKPVSMRGIKSAAMVLAASPRLSEGEADSHAGPVELVDPPEGAEGGQRVEFQGWEGEPEGVLNPKKKVWEMCQPGFTTTESLEVVFDVERAEQLKGELAAGKPALGKLVVRGGPSCKVKSLKGAVVR